MTSWFYHIRWRYPLTESSGASGMSHHISGQEVPNVLKALQYFKGACHSAVGWGIVLQVGRSWVWFPMVSMEFFINIILPAALWPGVDSASIGNEYQEYFLWGKSSWCIGLTTLSPSRANCLEIRQPQLSGTLRVCQSLFRDWCTFTILQNIRNNMHNNTTPHPARLYNFSNTAVRTPPLTTSILCQSKIQTESNWLYWHLKKHYASFIFSLLTIGTSYL